MPKIPDLSIKIEAFWFRNTLLAFEVIAYIDVIVVVVVGFVFSRHAIDRMARWRKENDCWPKKILIKFLYVL